MFTCEKTIPPIEYYLRIVGDSAAARGAAAEVARQLSEIRESNTRRPPSRRVASNHVGASADISPGIQQVRFRLAAAIATF